jgi:hypothetical protein
MNLRPILTFLEHHSLKRVSFSSSSASSWPTKLPSVTVRARKRRRKVNARPTPAPESLPKTQTPSSPKGWGVLWPQPHAVQSSSSEISSSKFPSSTQLRRAWLDYKQTWAAGLRGDNKVPGEDDSQDMMSEINKHDLKRKMEQNTKLIQDEAQEFLDNVSERSGIRNQDDLRNFATEMMHLATECLKEFMTGYRQGRDEEVDKMLNEYFLEEEKEEQSKRKPKRKPKRAVLRP